MQHVEAVPAVLDQAVILGPGRDHLQDRRGVLAGQHARSDNEGRLLGGDRRMVVEHLLQAGRASAHVMIAVVEVGLVADHADAHAGGQPALAQAGVDQRGFQARVGPDQHHRVGLLQPRDGGVEQPAFARTVAQGRAVLAAVDIGRAQGLEQVHGRLHRLRVLQVAGDHADAAGIGLPDLGGDGVERLGPGRGLQRLALAHIRPVEPLAHQAVDGRSASCRRSTLR